MKEHPILFSTSMVQAILEGRKTHTRRVIKDQPLLMDKAYYTAFKKDFGGRKCPYGQVGDMLWVKETFYLMKRNMSIEPIVVYRADIHHRDEPLIKWKPSIFMPRWASRITLEITDIKVQRLQDISLADIQAEGIPDNRATFNAPMQVEKYRSLWESINGKKHSWESNPFVWVISFKRLA